MRSPFLAILAVGSSTASAASGLLGLPPLSDLDIKHLLSGLGPAPTSDSRFHEWQAPGPNDLRSPCPGLNTAANHNFINHDGRNLNIPDLIGGLASAMNIGPDFTVAIGAVALSSSPNPLGGSFTLADIAQHNFPIEHDASISRLDAYFGDDSSFNHAPYSQYFDSFGSNSTSSIKTTAAAKYLRYKDSLANNPTFTYGLREMILSYGENALWTQVLGDPTSGVTRLDYAHYFFENERFPVELGWAPSKGQVNLLSLGAMVLEFFTQSPEPIPEGAKILGDSYKDLFEILGGGSNVVANLTQGISSVLGL